MTTDPRRRILTIPNVISLARIGGVVVFLWLLLGEGRIVAAALVFGIIGATDWVDGALARLLGQESELGRLLDPIADRVALAAATIGGTIAGIVPLPVTVVLVTREAVMLAAAALLLSKTGETLQVRWWGKAATFGLYSAVPSFYLAAADVMAGFFEVFAWVVAATSLVVYVWVAGGYLTEIRSRVVASKEAPE